MNNKAIYIYVSFILFSIFIFNSCSVKKNTDINLGDLNINNYETLIKIQKDRDNKMQNYKASTKINVEVKGFEISSSMQIWGIKGEKMKLSLSPFPFIEAARIFISTDKIEVWDKINNLKLEKTYKELSEKLDMPIDYQFIEDIILGRFINKDNLSAKIENWKNLKDKNRYEFEINNGKFVSKYIADSNALLSELKASAIKDKNNYVNVLINEHQNVDNKYFFPSKENIYIYSKGKMIFRFDIDWRKIQTDIEDFPNIDSNTPNNLRKVDFDYIIRMFK